MELAVQVCLPERGDKNQHSGCKQSASLWASVTTWALRHSHSIHKAAGQALCLPLCVWKGSGQCSASWLGHLAKLRQLLFTFYEDMMGKSSERQRVPNGGGGVLLCGWHFVVAFFFLMWHGWLNANEYRGQHLIGRSVLPPPTPPSVGKCQPYNAAVCHPAAHSSLIPP